MNRPTCAMPLCRRADPAQQKKTNVKDIKKEAVWMRIIEKDVYDGEETLKNQY